jgi:hypothetical protein
MLWLFVVLLLTLSGEIAFFLKRHKCFKIKGAKPKLFFPYWFRSIHPSALNMSGCGAIRHPSYYVREILFAENIHQRHVGRRSFDLDGYSRARNRSG